MGNQQRSSTRAIWHWKSNPKPWDSKEEPQWTSYTDIENDIIEEAYQSNQENVELDHYQIDFKHMVQISKVDKSRQRPIKKGLENNPLREERFFLPPSKPQTFSQDLNDVPHPSFTKEVSEYGVLRLRDYDKEFVEIMKRKDQNPDELEPGDIIYPIAVTIEKSPVPALRAAIKGIIKEGIELGCEAEAYWMVERLLKDCQRGGMEEVYKTCVFLYTKEGFLYKILNKALRENCDGKSKNLGGFCLMLNTYLRGRTCGYKCKIKRDPKSYKFDYYDFWLAGPLKTEEEVFDYFKKLVNSRTDKFNGVVYRGAHLDLEMIKCYEEDLKESGGVDIASLSAFPDEEEVLLPACSIFQIKEIKIVDLKLVISLKKVDNSPVLIDIDLPVPSNAHTIAELARELMG